VSPGLIERALEDAAECSRGRIATYGCAQRIVRVGWAGGRRGRLPQTALLDCPACGFRHRVHLLWRSLAPLDEGREPDLTLPVGEAT
jgi:hypothetical protein